MYWYIVNSISCDVSPIFLLLSQAACGDDDALRDLGAAATAVTEALNTLIQGIKDDVRNAEGDKYDEAVEAILAATERLFRWGAGGRIEAFSCWGAGVILKIFLVRGVKMNILSCSLPPLPFPPSLPPSPQLHGERPGDGAAGQAAGGGNLLSYQCHQERGRGGNGPRC